MQRILVTGGAGFIGSHTCVNLLEAGYEIISLDSFVNSSRNVFNAIKRICLARGINQDLIKNVECDIRDKRTIEEISKLSHFGAME